jgi:ribosome maturation factor RimP
MRRPAKPERIEGSPCSLTARSRVEGAVCPFFVPERNMQPKKLTDIVQPVVESLDFEFVGLEYTSNPKNPVLIIYIDHENGIAVENCAAVSREVAAILDVKDPIAGHYTLEVSSPGLDRPLFTEEQYASFAGQQAQLTLYAPEEGRRRFKGVILGAEKGQVSIEQDGVPVVLEFSNIAKARLVPDYENIF